MKHSDTELCQQAHPGLTLNTRRSTIYCQSDFLKMTPGKKFFTLMLINAPPHSTHSQVQIGRKADRQADTGNRHAVQTALPQSQAQPSEGRCLTRLGIGWSRQSAGSSLNASLLCAFSLPLLPCSIMRPGPGGPDWWWRSVQPTGTVFSVSSSNPGCGTPPGGPLKKKSRPGWQSWAGSKEIFLCVPPHLLKNGQKWRF